MSHTVTITKLPDEVDDDYGYEFGGMHGADCEFYDECQKDWHRHPKNADDYYDGWATKRVPELHKFLDGRWMVAVDTNIRCALEFVFEGYTPGEYFEGINIGETREVECRWEGEGWDLIVLDPSEVVSS